MSGEKHQINHITYEQNVSAIQSAGKNLPAGSSISEAPKDIQSNLTIPGYAEADRKVQQMIAECSQLIEAIATVMTKIGKNDHEVDNSGATTLNKGTAAGG